MTKESKPPSERPPVGDKESGKSAQEQVNWRDTKPLAPEAKGGAGAGRKWPGDS